MAAPIVTSATAAVAKTATSVADQTAGSRASREGASMSNTAIATQVPSVNCAMLKNTFTGGISRSATSGSAEPITQASSSSLWVRKRRPKISGSSPSEKECELRRKWKCTTHASARPNAAARPHQGICRSGRSPAMSAIANWYTAAAATAINSVRTQIVPRTPRRACSREAIRETRLTCRSPPCG